MLPGHLCLGIGTSLRSLGLCFPRSWRACRSRPTSLSLLGSNSGLGTGASKDGGQPLKTEPGVMTTERMTPNHFYEPLKNVVVPPLSPKAKVVMSLEEVVMTPTHILRTHTEWVAVPKVSAPGLADSRRCFGEDHSGRPAQVRWRCVASCWVPFNVPRFMQPGKGGEEGEGAQLSPCQALKEDHI